VGHSIFFAQSAAVVRAPLPLQRMAVQQQQQDGDGAAAPPKVEDWSEQNQRVVVRTHPEEMPGVLADIVLRAKVDGRPDDVYGVLTDPRSHAIFRGIRQTLERRKLSDDGRGRRTLLVSHQAVTRFLWLQVTFNTQLLVEEDDRARTITFKNAREGGFMRTFTGRWEVSPFSQDTLDRIFKPPHEQRHKGRFGWLSPVGAVGALQHREHLRADAIWDYGGPFAWLAAAAAFCILFSTRMH
jgi:hypothetical protein